MEAMEKVGRCPPERPGLGPKVARMNSVPIGEEVAEPRAIGAGGNPASAVAMAVNRATASGVPFRAGGSCRRHHGWSSMGSRVYQGSEVVAGGGRGEYGRRRRTKWIVSSSDSRSEIYCCAGKHPSV